MARQLLVEYPGAICHEMKRSGRSEPVFHKDRDRDLVLATLAEADGKTGWQVQAFCLMGITFIRWRCGGLLPDDPEAYGRIWRGWGWGAEAFRKECSDP